MGRALEIRLEAGSRQWLSCSWGVCSTGSAATCLICNNRAFVYDLHLLASHVKVFEVGVCLPAVLREDWGGNAEGEKEREDFRHDFPTKRNEFPQTGLLIYNLNRVYEPSLILLNP